jgi:hypothetical protein
MGYEIDFLPGKEFGSEWRANLHVAKKLSTGLA